MATIEIDGQTFEVENGKMIIEVADEMGIHIPRFCYHKKLSVAANCRMCLVEIENSKKTVPACATPINHGMKVYTQSQAALKSQQVVMEFLLINHPLDCPICDQGGECELQDISMGFGGDRSDFSETKRSVQDKNLGSLIATEMTRCIHCTRCVRFGEEIAGLREMGAPYRGENIQIGTYVEKSLCSEISGNIIDLCPVGALTSKPFQFQARAWELSQHPGIAAHDCLGSHINLHIRRGRLMRVIPKECDALNETWLSDRDRFSYTGLYSKQRLAQPMIKKNGQWQEVDWASALNFTATKLGEILAAYGPQAVAAFASSSATCEELYLLQKWMRSLDIENLDFRLRQQDFSMDQNGIGPIKNTIQYAEIENASGIFIIGSQVQRELPLLATRIRKAFLNGAQIAGLNFSQFMYPFNLEEHIVVSPLEFGREILAIAQALKIKLAGLSEDMQQYLAGIELNKAHRKIAKILTTQNPVLITGSWLERHPDYSELRACLHWICRHSAIRWLHISQGANSLGAWAANFIPREQGLNVKQALNQAMKAYILHGVEPSHDFFDAGCANIAMKQAEFVVALSAFKTEDLMEHAHVLLPMASLGETAGTFVNMDGLWQSFEGCAQPYEQTRPAWKIYRVLANLTNCSHFEYTSSREVLDEMRMHGEDGANFSGELTEKNVVMTSRDLQDGLVKVSGIALYGTDMLVRAAQVLQESAAADRSELHVHPSVVEKLNLGLNVTISQGDNKITLPLVIDEQLHVGTVRVSVAGDQKNLLGPDFERVSLSTAAEKRE